LQQIGAIGAPDEASADLGEKIVRLFTLAAANVEPAQVTSGTKLGVSIVLLACLRQ